MNDKTSITFFADSVAIRGPRQSDGQLTVVFTTGEYQMKEVATLLALPRETPLKITVEIHE